MGSRFRSRGFSCDDEVSGGNHTTLTHSSQISSTQSQSSQFEYHSSSRALLSDNTSEEGQGYATFAEIRSSRSRRDPSSDSNNSALPEDTGPPKDPNEAASWSSMPNKGQLAILTFARLSEPLAQTSLQAYMFYQLQSYDPSLPASVISTQAGIMQGSFTAAEFVTAMLWGQLADTESMGRKRVMLIGLGGTFISSIGFAFSKTFTAAVLFRVAAGVLNSNVGVLRTMVAEVVKEKKHQSLAFLILPMCFNIGIIIGPILGGSLANPIEAYPGIFGPGTRLGGKDGVAWMKEWPFALANLFNGFFAFIAMLSVLFGLKETHEVAQYRSDWGLKAGQAIKKTVMRHLMRYKPGYEPLQNQPEDGESFARGSTNGFPASVDAGLFRAKRKNRPGFREVWTLNLILILVINFLLGFHTNAFTSMTFTFLPTPRAPIDDQRWFRFGGGLGLEASQVGYATAIIGVIGLPLQIFVYPYVQARLGTLKSFRVFLPFSPISYLLLPFVVILPRLAYVVWPSFALVVFLQVVSRTFALPAGIILINSCISNSLVLGTVHGVAQSVISLGRTLGPIIGGWTLGLGFKYNIVGAAWWGLAVEALLGWVLLWTVYEGNGIEQNKVESE